MITLLRACGKMPQMALCFALATAGCGSSGANSGGDLGAGDAGGDFAAGVDLAGAACPLGADTTPSSTVTNGCARLVRDTSACNAARAAQGLTGAWLEFSCRVTLTHVTGAASYVQASSDSRPDYASNYFTTGDACWVAYTPAFPDPNTITVQSLSIKAPDAPDTAGAAMGLGPVGIAVNGVAIFDNQAAPGDDIFTEASSFDRCGGHPAPGGEYHYHGEPYAISYDDANLIGVLRDGYFVYGRRDAGGSLPTGLDAHGGHVAATPDSATPVYHYHLTQQTSTSSGTLGQMQWFLTTGTYEGTPLP